jgi:hypothetical protein
VTSSTNGSSPVTVFDQEWPDFTLDRAALRPSVDGDQTPNVTGVLRDVLGWRPVASDPKAFTAALQASFALTAVSRCRRTSVPCPAVRRRCMRGRRRA